MTSSAMTNSDNNLASACVGSAIKSERLPPLQPIDGINVHHPAKADRRRGVAKAEAV